MLFIDFVSIVYDIFCLSIGTFKYNERLVDIMSKLFFNNRFVCYFCKIVFNALRAVVSTRQISNILTFKLK